MATEPQQIIHVGSAEVSKWFPWKVSKQFLCTLIQGIMQFTEVKQNAEHAPYGLASLPISIGWDEIVCQSYELVVRSQKCTRSPKMMWASVLCVLFGWGHH